MAVAMAQKMGTFVDYDDTDPVGWGKYMRVKIDLPLNKPLRRQMRLQVGGGESKWVKIKYERLMDFCYACGMFGHVFGECESYDGRTPVDELDYGGWLAGSPNRKKKGNEHLKEEEKLMYQAFKTSIASSKARMQLDFEKAPTQNAGVNLSGGWGNKSSTDKSIAHVGLGVEKVSHSDDARTLKRGRQQGPSTAGVRNINVRDNFDVPMYDEEGSVGMMVNRFEKTIPHPNMVMHSVVAEVDVNQPRRDQ